MLIRLPRSPSPNNYQTFLCEYSDRVVKVCSHMNGEFHLVLDGGGSLKMSRSYKDKVKHFF